MGRSEENIALSLEWLRAARDRMLIVAHRGSSGRAPENTLAAFEMALEQGSDMIECDVRLTKDEEVVVFHDRTLDRTTNGKGPIEEQTLEELKRLDAGSWFSSRFSGERIPTLCEALRLLENRAFLNIELKADSRTHRRHDLLEEQVLRAVKNQQAESRVFLGSFNHRLVRVIKERNPQLMTAVIYKATRDFPFRPSRLVTRAKADAFVCGRWWLRSRLLTDVQDHHIPIFVYTVNRENDVKKMARLNVDGVITNFPDIVNNILKRFPRA